MSINDLFYDIDFEYDDDAIIMSPWLELLRYVFTIENSIQVIDENNDVLCTYYAYQCNSVLNGIKRFEYDYICESLSIVNRCDVAQIKRYLLYEK